MGSDPQSHPVTNPYIVRGIEQLRERWPQSHAVASDESIYAAHLITVPTVMLPDGFKQNVCTVLFVAPDGFPANPPTNFYTDIELELDDPHGFPYGTSRWSLPFDYEMYGLPWKAGGTVFVPWAKFWPQWDHVMLWHCRLQAWNPNHDGIYTYMKVIEQGLRYFSRVNGDVYGK